MTKSNSKNCSRTRRKTQQSKPTKAAALQFVTESFECNGYVRYPVKKGKTEEEIKRYKQGYEVRLSTSTEQELLYLHQCLEVLGFNYGKHYSQSRLQIRTPIYGRLQVEQFLKTIQPVIVLSNSNL